MGRGMILVMNVLSLSVSNGMSIVLYKKKKRVRMNGSVFHNDKCNITFSTECFTNSSIQYLSHNER